MTRTSVTSSHVVLKAAAGVASGAYFCLPGKPPETVKAVKHEHHYLFLLACCDGSVVPKGLTVKKTACVDNISEEFRESWAIVEDRSGNEFRNLLTNEHKKRSRRLQLQFRKEMIRKIKTDTIWDVLEDLLWVVESVNNVTNQLILRRMRKLSNLVPNLDYSKYEILTTFIFDILSVTRILFGEVQVYNKSDVSLIV